MIKIKINNERYCEFLRKENVYKGDNNISNFRIELPQTFGILPREECTIIMNCYLPEDGRLSYDINTDNSYTLQPITNDITEKEQKININFVIKHGDNVIGTTSLVELNILDAPDNSDEPLTPRAEFDEVIAEQRETIAEQENTISDQQEVIQANERTISGLNAQVSTLTAENTTLANQNETSRETIQHMIDNPPEPELYTPPEPIVPESETRVYTPPHDYDGFASFVIKGTKLINPELSVFLKREVPIDLTFDQRVVFDYICYGNTAIRSINFSENVYQIGESSFNSCTRVSEINFSVGLTEIKSSAFFGCVNLIKIILPHGLRDIAWRVFQGCTNLTTIFFPNSLTHSNQATMLDGCSKLQNVTLENGFNSNGLHLEASTLYSVDTIVGWLEALADRTGETASTLTMGTTNLNKLTAEQRAIATNKNWNLA